MGEVRRAYTQCPVCSYVFRPFASGNYATIGRDSDLCPKYPVRDSDAARLIQSGVTLCPACSFADAEPFEDILLTDVEREELQELLREDGLLGVYRSSQPAWLAFHAADLCGKERGYRYRDLADLCLRGSWVCRAEREQPFEMNALRVEWESNLLLSDAAQRPRITWWKESRLGLLPRRADQSFKLLWSRRYTENSVRLLKRRYGFRTDRWHESVPEGKLWDAVRDHEDARRIQAAIDRRRRFS